MKIQAIVFGLVLLVGNLNAAELPSNSIYQLESVWLSQKATEVAIAELGGQVQIMAFVYTYCEHTCPRILAKLESIDEALPPSLKEQVRITLVSLDPDRDTPAVLKAYMEQHRLDESRWTMLSGSAEAVRDLAAVLGTRYRPMGQDDIAHSNTLTVLDQSGIPVHQSKGLSEPVDTIIDVVRAAVLSGSG